MNLEIGTKYLINEELKTLCCPYVLKPGEVVEIFKVHSENRLIIAKGHTLHKVKRSSLNRTATELCLNKKY